MRSISESTYFRVFFALIALLALTAAAAWLPLGPVNTVIGLAVAVAKAALILLYFMHLRISPLENRLAAIVGFFWLAILLVLALSDFLTRGMIGVLGK